MSTWYQTHFFKTRKPTPHTVSCSCINVEKLALMGNNYEGSYELACLLMQFILVLWRIRCSLCSCHDYGDRHLAVDPGSIPAETYINHSWHQESNSPRPAQVLRKKNITDGHARTINPLKPNSSNYYTLPYGPNITFLISDIRALWRSALSARVPECQKLKMLR